MHKSSWQIINISKNRHSSVYVATDDVLDVRGSIPGKGMSIFAPP